MLEVWQGAIFTALIYAVAAIGLTVIVGHAGVFDVNHASIFAVGAFTYSALAIHGVTHEILLAWLVALPVSVILSAAIAWSALRISGELFLVASIGFQLVLIQVLFNIPSISGGATGLFDVPSPTLAGFLIANVSQFLYVSIGLVIVVLALTTWISRSPYGHLVRATGADQVAVAAAGFSPLRLRLGSLMLGGAFASGAGVVYAAYLQSSQVSDYGINLAIAFFAMVVIGGLGNLYGAVLGALVYTLLPVWFSELGLNGPSSSAVFDLMFGLLLVVIILLLPSGLISKATWAPVATWLGDRRSRRSDVSTTTYPRR
jgi:branched-chain amino acid transport system permease protein